MFNKDDFNKKLIKLSEFLEVNKNKAPSLATKAEFQCIHMDLLQQFASFEREDYELALEEMKKTFSNRGLYKTYSIFHKLSEAEQKKNNWKVVIN